MDISFHHGLFGSLRLDTVDCTSVPAEHLASLASSVTGDVYIGNVRGCGLVSILDSVKSKELYIQRQRGDPGPGAGHGVRWGDCQSDLWGDTGYQDLEGVQRPGEMQWDEVSHCHSDTADRYKEQLSTWATSRNWTVIRDEGYHFVIERI